MKKHLFLYLLLMISSSQAFAFTSINGENLLEMCRDSVSISETKTVDSDLYKAGQEVTNSGICIGYIEGFEDMHYLYSLFLFHTKFFTLNTTNDKTINFLHLYCLPDDVTRYQLTKVVVKYLEDHPEKLNQSAGLLVWQAFQEAFPCTKS